MNLDHHAIDIQDIALVAQALLAVFLATFAYQARMITLEKHGYFHMRRRNEFFMVRQRLERLYMME